ncbi:MAG: ABC transporter ATP-binding protein [Betaproteobacteria bacterium RBG_16_64_18]|nr:MAG: ABC transporter ATP-binding protein [Betaproteobacteria bacterium RBG_16_64_18]
MRFLWPELLWLLLAAPALVAAYLYALRRKKKATVRYTSLMLIRDALGPGQRWRRHLPPALFLLAMVTAILAIARPSASVILPAEHMTLIMAMDVSRSMQAADVEPNRISAAQAAAKSFIEELPRNVRLGIVSFAGTASLVQTPTGIREDLIAAIDRFQLQRGTATGSGLMLSLAQLFPDAGIDLESALYDNAYSRYGGLEGGRGAAPIDRERKSAKTGTKNFTPAVPGSYTTGAIILLSDGRRTTGPDPLEAARMAADRGVRVFTVGFGTQAGGTIPGWEGMSYYVRLDEETLKAVADITAGEYFHAGTAADLRKIYQSLNTKFAMERQETEVSALFSALAALLVIGAAVLSLLWFHRSA